MMTKLKTIFKKSLILIKIIVIVTNMIIIGHFFYHQNNYLLTKIQKKNNDQSFKTSLLIMKKRQKEINKIVIVSFFMINIIFIFLFSFISYHIPRKSWQLINLFIKKPTLFKTNEAFIKEYNDLRKNFFSLKEEALLWFKQYDEKIPKITFDDYQNIKENNHLLIKIKTLDENISLIKDHLDDLLNNWQFFINKTKDKKNIHKNDQFFNDYHQTIKPFSLIDHETRKKQNKLISLQNDFLNLVAQNTYFKKEIKKIIHQEIINNEKEKKKIIKHIHTIDKKIDENKIDVEKINQLQKEKEEDEKKVRALITCFNDLEIKKKQEEEIKESKNKKKNIINEHIIYEQTLAKINHFNKEINDLYQKKNIHDQKITKFKKNITITKINSLFYQFYRLVNEVTKEIKAHSINELITFSISYDPLLMFSEIKKKFHHFFHFFTIDNEDVQIIKAKMLLFYHVFFPIDRIMTIMKKIKKNDEDLMYIELKLKNTENEDFKISYQKDKEIKEKEREEMKSEINIIKDFYAKLNEGKKIAEKLTINNKKKFKRFEDKIANDERKKQQPWYSLLISLITQKNKLINKEILFDDDIIDSFLSEKKKKNESKKIYHEDAPINTFSLTTIEERKKIANNIKFNEKEIETIDEQYQKIGEQCQEKKQAWLKIDNELKIIQKQYQEIIKQKKNWEQKGQMYEQYDEAKKKEAEAWRQYQKSVFQLEKIGTIWEEKHYPFQKKEKPIKPYQNNQINDIKNKIKKLINDELIAKQKLFEKQSLNKDEQAKITKQIKAIKEKKMINEWILLKKERTAIDDDINDKKERKKLCFLVIVHYQNENELAALLKKAKETKKMTVAEKEAIEHKETVLTKIKEVETGIAMMTISNEEENVMKAKLLDQIIINQQEQIRTSYEQETNDDKLKIICEQQRIVINIIEYKDKIINEEKKINYFAKIFFLQAKNEQWKTKNNDHWLSKETKKKPLKKKQHYDNEKEEEIRMFINAINDNNIMIETIVKECKLLITNLKFIYR